jgi:hypothetical protein
MRPQPLPPGLKRQNAIRAAVPIAAQPEPPAYVDHEDPIEHVLDKLAEYELDPLGFVMWAFPWGQPGTTLELEEGPEQWQHDQLQRIGERLRAGESTGVVIKEAISAGHGVGKSALVAWLILWAISTFEDTRGVVTANTKDQLVQKTWAELARWHQVFMARELFVLTATAIYSADPLHVRTWRIDAVPWSEENSEAFAGLHNKGRRGRADRRQDANPLVRLRQPNAHHRPLPPLVHQAGQLDLSPRRQPQGPVHQQGADRRVGKGIRGRLRFLPGARQG